VFRSGAWETDKVFKKIVKVALIEKVRFKQRPEGDEGVIQAGYLGRGTFHTEGTATTKALGWV
jgi:hypothetical protein